MNKFFCALLIVITLIGACFAAPADKDKAKAKENAILIVSFGTSMPEARKAIDNLVNSAKKEFPKYDVRLAFTSNIIRRKLDKSIPNPVQALAALNDEGFKNVYIMPTHMIPGEEYDEISSVASAFWSLSGSKYGFENLALGTPFLNSVKDCERMSQILAARFKAQLQDKDTAIILMGHGTPKHHANALYSQLQVVLNQKYYGRFFIGTVEAAPLISDVIAELKRHPEIKKLVLSPLMIVAGDHANNDMAGDWVKALQDNGYEAENISTYLVGLGEDSNLASDFVMKIHALADALDVDVDD